MFFQNHADSRLKACITSNQMTKMPANTGIMIAHRNGLLRAQAEHIISQPTVGSAHNTYTGIDGDQQRGDLQRTARAPQQRASDCRRAAARRR